MFPGRGGRGSFPKMPNSRGRLGSFLEALNSGSRLGLFPVRVNSGDRRRGSFPEASNVFKAGFTVDWGAACYFQACGGGSSCPLGCFA